jgi:ADP-ribose pyrophosphatase YjhB (NUDIX family)
MAIERTHILARALIPRDGPEGMCVLLAHQLGAAHTFLPGGHVEPDEGLVASVRRELREELGLESHVLGYLGTVEAQWPDPDPRHYEVTNIFLTALDDPPDVPESREGHLEFFWCPVAALRERNLLPAPLPGLIERYLAGDRGVWWGSVLPLADGDVAAGL